MSGLALKTYWPTSSGTPAFGGKAAAIIDRREDGQTVLLAELVVVLAVARRDVDEAGARVGGDEIGGKDLTSAAIVEEGMSVGETDEVGAFERADN